MEHTGLLEGFSTEQLHYFFVEKSGVIKTLTQEEKFFLAEAYFFNEYKSVISPEEDAKRVSCPATLMLHEGQQIKMARGTMVIINDSQTVKLKTQVVWENSHSAGLRLLHAPKEWLEMIEHADEKFSGAKKSQAA